MKKRFFLIPGVRPAIVSFWSGSVGRLKNTLLMSSHYRVALPWEGHVPLAPTAEFESPSDFLVKYLNRRFCSFYDNALVSLTEHV